MIRTHQLQEESFKNINSPEMAYFLGYMWADGHVSNREFSLEILEKDFIEIWPVLQQIGFARYNIRKRKNSKNFQANIRCGQKRIVDCLNLMGFGEKSINPPNKVLKNIPKQFHKFFYRGYFDGDGTVCIDKNMAFKVSIYSGFGYDWDFMKKLCDDIGLSSTTSRNCIRRNKTQTYSVFFLNKKREMVIFLSYLYENFEVEKIGLSRKYNKFQEMLKIINEFDNKPIFEVKRIDSGIIQTRGGKFRTFSLISVCGVQKYLGVFNSLEESINAQNIFHEKN